ALERPLDHCVADVATSAADVALVHPSAVRHLGGPLTTTHRDVDGLALRGERLLCRRFRALCGKIAVTSKELTEVAFDRLAIRCEIRAVDLVTTPSAGIRVLGFGRLC